VGSGCRGFRHTLLTREQLSQGIQSVERSIACIVVAGNLDSGGRVMVTEDKLILRIGTFTLRGLQGLDSRLTARLHIFSHPKHKTPFFRL
jgi:hypothetical protein